MAAEQCDTRAGYLAPNTEHLKRIRIHVDANFSWKQQNKLRNAQSKMYRSQGNTLKIKSVLLNLY